MCNKKKGLLFFLLHRLQGQADYRYHLYNLYNSTTLAYFLFATPVPVPNDKKFWII